MGNGDIHLKKFISKYFPIKNNNPVESVASIIFAIFLFGIFINAQHMPLNPDIEKIRNSNLIIYQEGMSHASPLLGVLFYNLLPVQTFHWLSPFGLVAVYLSLYFLVSKKIIYWWPLLMLIPPFFSTIIPAVIDWIILPVVYNRLVNGYDKQAIFLSVALVYFHGPYAFVYLPILFLFLSKKKELFWVVILSIPQLLPLLYFSQGYILYAQKDYLWFTIFGIFDFVMSYFNFRILTSINYIVVLLALLIDEKSRRHYMLETTKG
ncbi:MAG: hypothetical protein ACXACY_30070 [Candidatus Hodarchaeales archaeon]|jgi:hypothetical protein